MNKNLMAEAVALHQAGKYEEAKQTYNKLARQFPRDADLLHFRGLLASHMGDQAEAVRLIGEAIAVNPDMPDYHQNLAISHQQAGNAQEASVSYNNQGVMLQKRHDVALARAAFEKSLALDGENYRAAANYATILNEQGQSDRALSLLKKIERRVQSGEEKALVLSNIGTCYYAMGKIKKAVQSFDTALKIDSTYIDAKRNRAVALLLDGKIKEGFAEYESRCIDGVHYMNTDRKFSQPVWRGQPPEDLNGPLLVLQEQGLGDVIQFSRYVKLLSQKGYQLLFESMPELYNLFVEGWADDKNIQVIPRQSDGKIFENTSYGAYVSLMSLPHILGTTIDSIPAETPYLSCAPHRIQQWDDVMPRDGVLNIGLIWQGSRNTRHDWRRSILPEKLEPILRQANVRFYSLQKDETYPFKAPVVALNERLRDFADTAGAIKHLDLVISIDSSVAHLAGALDCPVWLALPRVLDWRWMMDRNDTPWYKKTRLFRQKKPDDWGSVITDIGKALDKMHAQKYAA